MVVTESRYVDTPLVIVLGCLGGLLVILGGGWVIFFYCARPPKATKSQEQLDIEEADRTAASRSLCEPMMNVADANHEEPELRCPACHAVVQSKYDQFCLNTVRGYRGCVLCVHWVLRPLEAKFNFSLWVHCSCAGRS